MTMMMMWGMKDDHQGVPALAEPKKMLRIFRLLEEVIDGTTFRIGNEIRWNMERIEGSMLSNTESN